VIVTQALLTATQQLNHIDGGARDARIIMAHALGIDRSRLTLHMSDDLSAKDESLFNNLIEQRAGHMPVSHILGGREFYGRWFKVTPDVLDPRADTETLIDLALMQPFTNVADLGTGTGAIIVTLLAERPDAVGVATDISPQALLIASENAQSHQVQPRLKITRSDWFDNLDGQFDLIVSNPPYIAADEMPGLAPDVRDYEPEIALTDNADGLTAYRNIATTVADHLTPQGRVMVEIGPSQAVDVSALFAQAGLENITVHQDLDHRDRVVSAINPA